MFFNEGYKEYGVDEEIINKVKKKLKQPKMRGKIIGIFSSASKADLQSKVQLKKMVRQLSRTTGVTIGPKQSQNMVSFIMDQKIDPNNPLHLIKIISMFK
ncbi:stage VI sporulation protein F [Longirhabdus pacifica]|uniref:stage VI sporulation protein F n=1 Tax=Longirhabdus pacifica TaxID=2305227 RepID=UPI001F0CD01D|nr:stage VI sporulation protein F [Longirhabdus pacifica]